MSRIPWLSLAICTLLVVAFWGWPVAIAGFVAVAFMAGALTGRAIGIDEERKRQDELFDDEYADLVSELGRAEN